MKNNKKIFCLGWCKTGTTSLEHALTRLGFIGPESEGMNALNSIEENDYDSLWKITDKYDYFCDYPWFYKGLYEKLDKKYPNSLFILTTRDVESWHISTKKWFSRPGKSDHPIISAIYGGSTETCVPLYESHNANVIDYFKNKPNRFLKFDVFEGDGWEKLCNFLNVDNPYPEKEFLWLNKQ